MTTEDRMRAAAYALPLVDFGSTQAIQAAAAVADAMVAEAVRELTGKLAGERQLSASAGACAAEYRKRIDERDVLILTLTGERDMLKERLAKLQGEMV